jgi:Anti-sigma-K factor rskA
MSHPEDEVLVDLAAGEQVDAAVRAHVTTCPRCSAEVSSLREVLLAVREPRPELVAAPPGVWEAVSAEIRRADVAPELRSEPTDLDRSGGATAAAEHGATTSPPASGEPVDLAARQRDRGRRRAPLMWIAAAAAAGLVVGAVGGRLADRTESEPTAVTVASTTLDTLDTRQARGTAEVLRHADGVDLALRTVPLDPPQDGYLEVWLINEDLQRMVSVGVLRPDTPDQTFPIPQQLLDEGYVIVDISREGFDESPEHSGDSVVRGSLAT